jgi:hypothetical protein
VRGGEKRRERRTQKEGMKELYPKFNFSRGEIFRFEQASAFNV